MDGVGALRDFVCVVAIVLSLLLLFLRTLGNVRILLQRAALVLLPAATLLVRRLRARG
jgi:uncharacterized membrane protein YhaH (DUF805 family)